MKILKWIKEKLKTESVEPYDYKRDMSNRCNRTIYYFAYYQINLKKDKL